MSNEVCDNCGKPVVPDGEATQWWKHDLSGRYFCDSEFATVNGNGEAPGPDRSVESDQTAQGVTE